MSLKQSTIEEELAAHGVHYATTEGDSMEPLFHTHQSVVCFRPYTGRLKRLDVPLVRREDGHCVLHRIVKVRKDGYITRTSPQEDSRCNEIRITEAGRCAIRQSRDVFDAVDHGMLEGLSQEERDALLDMLCRMRDNLSRYDGETTPSPSETPVE